MPPMHPETDSVAPPVRQPLGRWLLEGLRAGFFLKPRLAAGAPGPAQLLALIVLVSGLELLLARFEIAGPVLFDLRGWLAPQWGTALLLLLAWWLLPHAGGDSASPRGLAAWFALWVIASMPANTVSQLLGIAQAHEQLPLWLDGATWAGWALYLLLWVWMVGVGVRLAARWKSVV